MMYTAYVHHHKGPFVIRYPRGKGHCKDWNVPLAEIPMGKSIELTKGTKLAFILMDLLASEVKKAIKEATEARSQS